MRKLIFAINVTMDGCCDHEKGLSSEEVHQYFTQLTKEAGALLYGRKTYELMVPFWPDIAQSSIGQPKVMKEFAKAFVSVPQLVVFSKTLASVEKKIQQFYALIYETKSSGLNKDLVIAF